MESYNIKRKYPISNRSTQQANIWTWHPESQEVVVMSPQEFLAKSAAPEDGSWIRHDRKQIRERIRLGLPLDPPWLDIDHNSGRVLGHEGRHRALASIEEGLTEIPVVIFHLRGSIGNYVDLTTDC